MNIEQLKQKAKWIRQEIFKFKTATGNGHLVSCLSCVDILTSLYYNSTSIFKPNTDEIIFSKAHGSPSIYPILADLNYINKIELAKYSKMNGILRMHSDYSIPQCQFVGGSLGNGIGYAAGRAYNSNKNIFVIMGDGELYEGSVWESFMFISHHNINNIKIIIDRNNLCILGHTENMIKLNPLDKKFESFGFSVKTIDGHDFEQLNNSFSYMNTTPEVIIANTVKGKGVKYMENEWRYHTIIPKEQYLIDQGLFELGLYDNCSTAI